MVTTTRTNKIATGPRPMIPSTSIFANISKKVQEAAQMSEKINVQHLFYRKIEADENRKLRFLADYEDGVEIRVHNRYRQGADDNLMDAVCYSMYSLDGLHALECPYCQEMDMDADCKIDICTKVCWPVYLVPTDKEIKAGMERGRFSLLFFKYSKMSVVGHLTKLYGNPEILNGTLLENDFLFSRTGKTMNDTVYSVTALPNRLKGVHTDHLPVPDKAKMLELATRAFNSDLYQIIQEAGLCDGNDYWLENKGVEPVVKPTPKPAPKPLISGNVVNPNPAARKQQAAARAENEEEEEGFTVEGLQSLLDNAEENEE